MDAQHELLASKSFVREVRRPLTEDERDSLLLDMHDRIIGMGVRIEALPDHENRLRSLERWKYGIPGTLVLALLALLGSSAPGGVLAVPLHW